MNKLKNAVHVGLDSYGLRYFRLFLCHFIMFQMRKKKKYSKSYCILLHDNVKHKIQNEIDIELPFWLIIEYI